MAGYFSLPAEPPFWAAPTAAGLCFSLAYVLRRRTGIVLLFLGLALIGCGVFASQIRSVSVAAPVLLEKMGSVELQGRLVESGIGEGLVGAVPHAVWAQTIGLDADGTGT